RAFLEQGNLASALDEIAKLGAKERKAALVLAIDRCRAWCAGDFVPIESEGKAGTSFRLAWQGTEEQRAAAGLVALALGGPEELVSGLRSSNAVQLRWGLNALPILERFKPSWLASGGAEVLFDEELLDFSLMMALRERKLCPQPKSERYAVAIIAAPRGFYRGTTFLELLDAHPNFRRADLRLIFGVEGTSENSLAALDKYSKGTGGWTHVLLTLVERGELGRGELLDITLEVLSRGYPSFRAGWYSRFHEHLAPSLEERGARQAGYERLLGSAVPQTASFALKALEQLHKKRMLQTAGFLAAVEPVLTAAPAETVKRALKMLSALTQTDLDSRGRIAELSLLALAHPEAGVQMAALELFRQSGGPTHAELVGRLELAAPGLAPSVRSALGPLPQAEQARVAVEAVAWFRPNPFAEERALSPPTTLEAGLECMSRALEQPQDAELFELALDCASRFGAAAPTELQRLGGPLRKRALQLLKRGPMHTLQYELVRVALAWVAQQRHAHPHAELAVRGKMQPFLWGRGDALITRLIGGRGGPLLSAPTHQHGHLAEAELVRRLEAHDGPIDREDAVLALLRLPETAASRLLPELSARVVGARSALESAVASFASERTRPRVLRWGDQYVWHRVLIDIEPPSQSQDPADFPALLLQALAKEQGAYGFEAWLPLALPRAGEWVAAAECLEHGGFGFDEVARTGELRCWRDPSTEPGPNAYLALAIALGTRSSSISLSARDTLIAEIASGRLRAELLGRAFVTLLTSGLIKVGRWYGHLAEIAAISPLYSRAIWRSLLSALRGDAAAFPRDFSKLLGLAKELQIALC
ncbi:MAG TPA: DUF6493 family protein, partial [Polyangiaceae bacterium]|nr:DUF6493 family protein [Polyangiaceae bacterium]